MPQGVSHLELLIEPVCEAQHAPFPISHIFPGFQTFWPFLEPTFLLDITFTVFISYINIPDCFLYLKAS